MAKRASDLRRMAFAGLLVVLAAARLGTAGQWKLPEGIEIDPHSLRASADRKHLLFLEMGSRSKSSFEVLRRLYPSAYWMLKTKNGKMTNLLELLDVEEGDGDLLVRPCGLSADGKYALILAGRIERSRIKRQLRDGLGAYVVHLQSAKARKIGDEVGLAVWVGNHAALSRIRGQGKERKIEKIELVNPADGSFRLLNISGMVICGHLDGRMLVHGADPEDPSQAVEVSKLGKAEMIVITTEGKLMRRLGIVPPVDARPDQLILSYNGKYVAFREGHLRRGRKPKNVNVRVMTTAGDEDWTIEEAATPIGLTDLGQVITVGNVFEDEGAAVKVWLNATQSYEVVNGAAAAALAANEVFYLTVGQNPLIKSLLLGF